jgi:hypothetical protein
MWVFLFSSLFVVSYLMLLLLAQRCSLFDVTSPLATPCSMFVVRHHYSLFDAFAPLVAPCSTLLLLLLFLTWHCCPIAALRLMVLHLVRHYYSSCYSFYCSLFNVTTPLATLWSTLLLLLLFFGQHFNAPWSMLLLLYLFNLDMACSSTFLLCCDVIVPLLLTRCYCSYSSCFRFIFPPLIFCRCGKNSPNSNFQVRLRRWDLFFQY